MQYFLFIIIICNNKEIRLYIVHNYICSIGILFHKENVHFSCEEKSASFPLALCSTPCSNMMIIHSKINTQYFTF